jgi:hypothetical protein
MSAYGRWEYALQADYPLTLGHSEALLAGVQTKKNKTKPLCDMHIAFHIGRRIASPQSLFYSKIATTI